MANPVVLIVGRLSGPKNHVHLCILRQVAPAVAAKIRGVRFQVVGGPVGEEHRQLEKESAFIKFEGHQKNMKPFYQKATVVVGAGRVALEAMVLRKPVVAIGEKLYIGPISAENQEKALVTNFGDCWGEESFDYPRMAKDLLDLLKNPAQRAQTAKTGFKLVESEYDQAKVASQTQALYQKVVLEKNLSRFHEIPVLMYHRVVEKAVADSKYNVFITKADLENQLQSLKERGFDTVTFEDLLTRRVGPKPVILTFDDGYEDNYLNLFPLLRKYGMRAVLYILGNRKHKNNFWDTPQGEPEAALLSERQIREMDESGLVEFGAHSMDHARLTELKPAEVQKQVAGSRRAIEGFLKKPAISFAYPYGLFNPEVKEITRQAGYLFAIAVNNGPTRFGKDLMEIRRVHMPVHTSAFGFWKKTSGFYHRYRKLAGK